MRLALVVRGVVQGVGFRPFVRRAALARGLSGWVKNGRDALRIEVQGGREAVDGFVRALRAECPGPAAIEAVDARRLADRPEVGFRILASDADAPAAPVLPADIATCPACAAEVSTPGERRYRYPFTNCAQCGPRWSIALRLPYDRRNTAMARFAMCAPCAREYDDPDDRRHHAQPIACPRCGPRLSWWRDGALRAEGEAALGEAVGLLRSGGILALRGLGGFQLLVDAHDARAVAELRRRKHRPHKPFAVLFRDPPQVESSCLANAEELSLLRSPQAPIVLLSRREPCPLAPEVAPDSPYVGALLPYTPLHRLLAEALDRPLVCTSGNASGEPMCVDLVEAVARLSGVADGFLSHDRDIVRPLDDSVARVTSRGPELLRRARGYAPRPVARVPEGPTVLAVGAHLKSSIALAHRGAILVSQHLGDLDDPGTRALLLRTAADLCAFFDARPALVACDLHPDYGSTLLAETLAREWQAPIVRIQHHQAHVAAAIAEHGLTGEVLGLAWDGTGLGTDGTIWGGEALVFSGGRFERVASLRPFPLPGGDRAARSPRRSALGALHELVPEVFERQAAAWSEARTSSGPPVQPRPLRAGESLALVQRQLDRRLNAPLCSSVGRLFDAAAALLGLSAVHYDGVHYDGVTYEGVTYEGQAAIALEHLAARAPDAPGYPLPLISPKGASLLRGDTGPTLRALLADRDRGVDLSTIASRFHNALVDLAEAIALRAAIPRIVLTGGCFQNRLLLERTRHRLERHGFCVFSAAQVPANDGGISVGQAFVGVSY